MNGLVNKDNIVFATPKKELICGQCVNKAGMSRKVKTEIFVEKGFTLKYFPKENIVKCNSCGREIKVIKTPEDFKKEEQEMEKQRKENLHLYCSGKSWSSGLNYYKLSTRVDYDVWKKIKDLFWYNNYNPEDDEFDAVGSITGWVTTAPYEVEERLSNMIKPENRLEYRQKKAEEERKKAAEEKRKQKEIKEKIMKAFEEAETPEKAKPEGTEYEDPSYEWNIYGGGRMFIINKEKNEIWLLKNNGFDGADWSRNNVETGGAGAIGYVVEYTAELEELIKKYCLR
ncbi:hypothetical protein [Methanobrevibacter wolinii]|uniref:hypothetical protein n=1 Tax=Methanobrevibacter wolinii TaxID=190977 RepID=UPI0012EB3D90|nr:hypothetical protein [Methanobrevibacter wolinii]